MDFTVRPFEQVVDRGPSALPSVARGSIEAETFYFDVDGATYPIPTVSVGKDDRGEYAVVRESEFQVNLGFFVRVEVDPDEDLPEGPWGCSIGLWKPHPDLERYKAAYPDMNVLMPPDYGLTICFSPKGCVNGWSAGSTSW